MYNLQVKNDYSSYDAGNKTSIRNKKSRASQDANFSTQVESAKQATKNAFSFDKLTPTEKAREQSHQKKKSQLVGNDAYQEQHPANVSRSMRVTKMANRGASLFNGL
jgi:hypothetical protein